MTITDTLTQALGTVVDTGSKLVLAKAGIGNAPTDQPKTAPAASGLPPDESPARRAPAPAASVPSWVWAAAAGAVSVAAIVFFLRKR